MSRVVGDGGVIGWLAMTWIMLSLFMTTPTVFLGHYWAQVSKPKPTVGLLLFAWLAITQIGLLVSFVVGFPAPGDMRDIDDTMWTRVLVMPMAGVSLSGLESWSWWRQVIRRDPAVWSTLHPQGGVLRLHKPQMAALGLMIVVAGVRGFQDSPIGIEYHWWLVALASGLVIWNLNWITGRGATTNWRLDPREVKVSLGLAVFALALFFIQPAGLAPTCSECLNFGSP